MPAGTRAGSRGVGDLAGAPAGEDEQPTVGGQRDRAVARGLLELAGARGARGVEGVDDDVGRARPVLRLRGERIHLRVDVPAEGRIGRGQREAHAAGQGEMLDQDL